MKSGTWSREKTLTRASNRHLQIRRQVNLNETALWHIWISSKRCPRVLKPAYVGNCFNVTWNLHVNALNTRTCSSRATTLPRRKLKGNIICRQMLQRSSICMCRIMLSVTQLFPLTMLTWKHITTRILSVLKQTKPKTSNT